MVFGEAVQSNFVRVISKAFTHILILWLKLRNFGALIWAESGVRTLMLQIYGDAGAAAWMGGYTM